MQALQALKLRSIAKVVILSGFALCTPSLLAQSGLVTYTAEYEASYKGKRIGTSVFSVTRDKSSSAYIYESITTVKGLARFVSPRPVIDRSLFETIDGAIRPLEFWHEDGSRKGEENEHIAFNWEDGLAVMSGEFGSRELNLKPGIVDRASLQVTIMADLNRGIEPMRYAVANEDSIEVYNYVAQGNTQISTRIGELDAVSYVQQREGSSRRTIIYMAPALEHVPIRIEQLRDDETLSAFVLTAFERL